MSTTCSKVKSGCLVLVAPVLETSRERFKPTEDVEVERGRLAPLDLSLFALIRLRYSAKGEVVLLELEGVTVEMEGRRGLEPGDWSPPLDMDDSEGEGDLLPPALDFDSFVRVTEADPSVVTVLATPAVLPAVAVALVLLVRWRIILKRSISSRICSAISVLRIGLK